MTNTTALAGIAPGFLHTDGSQIVDSAGNAVRLTGVNWFGAEGYAFAPQGLWMDSYQHHMDKMKELGFNVIRLPFSDAMLDAGRKPTGIDYARNPDLVGKTSLEVFDKIIDYAGQIGMKIILDHHRSGDGASANENGLWYTDQYPESTMIENWTMLAARYKGKDAVIGADLHNEPHGAATWGTGSASTDWARAAERIGNAIQTVNTDWLLIVEGVEVINNSWYWWGGNLLNEANYQVTFNTANRLVYSVHDYGPSLYMMDWFKNPNFPNNMPAKWDQMWGHFLKNDETPILVGEFGSRMETAIDRAWMPKLVQYMNGDWDGNGTIDLAAGDQGASWTYWAWSPGSGDTGGIMTSDWQIDYAKYNAIKSGLFSGATATPIPVPPSPQPPAIPPAVPPAPATTLTGRGGLDTLIGGSGADWATLGEGGGTCHVAGVETLIGGGGADWVNLGDSGNTLILAAVETLVGGASGDWVNLGNRGNTMILAAVETLIGGAGGDWINLGNRGNSMILTAVETLIGGSGQDNVALGNRGNTVILTAIETLAGGAGQDNVTLGNRGNTLQVSGVETLIGGGSTDDVTITAGPVRFEGRGGGDRLTLNPGGGVDTVVFSSVDDGGTGGATTGFDTIAGFQSGTDRIAVIDALRAAVDRTGDGLLAAVQRAGGTADLRSDELVELTTQVSFLADDGFAAFRAAMGSVASDGTLHHALVLASDGFNSGLYLVSDADGTLGANEVRLIGMASGSRLSAFDVSLG